MTWDIAIVGMGAILPGAQDLSQLWDNLVARRDAADDVSDRWILPRELAVARDGKQQDDRARSHRACLVQHNLSLDIEGIPDEAINTLDPTVTWALHAGQTAYRQANTAAIDHTRMGVVLAAIALPTEGACALAQETIGAAFEAHTFGHRVPPTQQRPYQTFNAQVTGLPGSLLAQSLGLGAGSVTLDAACASSLYALKLACDELRFGRTDAMLAGGVSRPDPLYTQIGFSQLQALSPSGRCAPFDASADGLVVGEGAGIFLLKRLEDAIAHEDEILGVIKGIGLSNDIRGALLAPACEGQIRAMTDAYAQANWSPTDVDFIECHGTGTRLGDLRESESLCQLWSSHEWSPSQCAIGSIKSNIGHLLTAAAAAGTIKTLLGFQHQTLPPSAHFASSPATSPLPDSPFRVQAEAETWTRRDPSTPRRAAVSAFGFGGINAHMLLEEWDEATQAPFERPQPETPPIAIVGMAAHVGTAATWSDFTTACWQGDDVFQTRPSHRWYGADTWLSAEIPKWADWAQRGGYIDAIEVPIGRFPIPPNEIDQTLPQQLLMLEVATDAMEDAGFQAQGDKTHFGAVIGIQFDLAATHFHLRWKMPSLAKTWAKTLGLSLTETQLQEWTTELQDAISPALNGPRTVGALGGIVASRVAKTLGLGGPCFVVSAAENAGLCALEIGTRALQQKEADAFLIGAIDLSGDLRHMVDSPALQHHREPKITPFGADGLSVGEGAGAIVIERHTDAIARNRPIYAVLQGLGRVSGGTPFTTVAKQETHRVIAQTCAEAKCTPQDIGLLELGLTGIGERDRNQLAWLDQAFASQDSPIALSSTTPIAGHTHALAGLLSMMKAAACLAQRRLPPLPGFVKRATARESAFHMPTQPQYWLRDRCEGPRRAAIHSVGTDGSAVHVVLAEAEGQNLATHTDHSNHASPALFVLAADDRNGLRNQILDLRNVIETTPSVAVASRQWWSRSDHNQGKLALALVCKPNGNIAAQLDTADLHLTQSPHIPCMGLQGIFYTPTPLGPDAKLAFVYPGSGNHYIGMGRDIGIHWPMVFDAMDAETERLRTQWRPTQWVPWRNDWSEGWEQDAENKVKEDAHTPIFGQVVHGGMMTRLAQLFGLQPQAAIGYSLGESAALFGLGIWPERGEMLKRMEASQLFQTLLAGPCETARQVWQIPEDEAVDWAPAVFACPASEVASRIDAKATTARLLIVNTDDECVVGGRGPDVRALQRAIGCQTWPLEGVVTVHCEAAAPEAEAYKALHIFPTTPIEGVDIYSGYWGRSYELTSDNAAESIVLQALHGFDYTKTINQAYDDGIRLFIEMGPRNSCSRMIRKILGEKEHFAQSICVQGEEDSLSVARLLAALATHRRPLEFASWFSAHTPAQIETKEESIPNIKVTLGTAPTAIVPTPQPLPIYTWPAQGQREPMKPLEFPRPGSQQTPQQVAHAPHPVAPPLQPHAAPVGAEATPASVLTRARETAAAHSAYLQFVAQSTQDMSAALATQSQLLAAMMSAPQGQHPRATPHVTNAPTNGHHHPIHPTHTAATQPVVAFNREQCMEFAIGSLGRVFGPMFAEVDNYPVRVRLPDEPLMLVDRILTIDAEMGAMDRGNLVTEHDVNPGAWYLDAGRAPVCVSVEAGQADLFLCSYLGVDLEVKGTRAYRLLDAEIHFHRGLPRVGEVIRYDITIDKFVRQGDVILFFFRFDGTIDGLPLLTMRNGCAGFFTPQEVEDSGGILLTEDDTRPMPGVVSEGYKPLLQVPRDGYPDEAITALRRGNLGACFGPTFADLPIKKPATLPSGKLRLLHRVVSLSSDGGRFGLGYVKAEADIQPDDWFLTCHFVDDMVMPGTLMYECCAHTLRVLLMRMGWIGEADQVAYEPVPGVKSVLRCRGPVTTSTKQVVYEVEIKEIGTHPHPYVIADALMTADGKRVVSFKDMSMQMTGGDYQALQQMWQGIEAAQAPSATPSPALYDSDSIMAYAVGKPSEAFGEPYRIFDEDRIIARLPGPPYLFLDRIVTLNPKPWELQAGGWIEGEYEVPPTAWYFAANRQATMPFAVLLEIVLQPCGWLAAYLGSALRCQEDVSFRNLGGAATLYEAIGPDAGMLTTRVRMTSVAQAGGMLIEKFDLQLWSEGRLLYEGNTEFGFFTKAALAEQVGIRGAGERVYHPQQPERTIELAHVEPLTPDAAEGLAVPTQNKSELPAKAFLMLDQVDIFEPNGGPHGLGYIKGSKWIDPQEWFFAAHFYQDPVCPGSLGLESFLQLLKHYMMERWPEKCAKGLQFAPILLNEPHQWIYRGQILPTAKRAEIEAVITEVREGSYPVVKANGFLKVDGLFIYEMIDFGLTWMAPPASQRVTTPRTS